MELIIKRDQDKGFLGGMNFILEVKAVLTDEEKGLVKKYKANKHVLFSKGDYRSCTIDDLTYGIKDKVKDVSVLLQNENIYIGACKHLKTLLDVMKTFGGEDRLTFKHDGVYDSSGEKLE